MNGVRLEREKKERKKDLPSPRRMIADSYLTTKERKNNTKKKEKRKRKKGGEPRPLERTGGRERERERDQRLRRRWIILLQRDKQTDRDES